MIKFYGLGDPSERLRICRPQAGFGQLVPEDWPEESGHGIPDDGRAGCGREVFGADQQPFGIWRDP